MNPTWSTVLWKYERMHGPHERMQKKIHLISFDPYLLDICKLANGSLLVSQDGDRVIFQGTSRTIKIPTQGSDFTMKFLWVVRIPIPTSGLTFMGTLRRLFIVLHFSVCLNIFRSAERHHLGFLWRAFWEEHNRPLPGNRYSPQISFAMKKGQQNNMGVIESSTSRKK